MGLVRINPDVAIVALAHAKKCSEIYTAYLRIYFRATGELAVGFTRKDLYRWYQKNMPEAWQELRAKGRYAK